MLPALYLPCYEKDHCHYCLHCFYLIYRRTVQRPGCATVDRHYGYVSLAALGAYFNRVPRWAIYAGMIVCLIWMGTLFKDFIHWIQMGMPSIVDEMHTTKPHIELVREFLGLLLAMIGLWVVRPREITRGTRNVTGETRRVVVFVGHLWGVPTARYASMGIISWIKIHRNAMSRADGSGSPFHT